jgi:hypothetical protein
MKIEEFVTVPSMPYENQLVQPAPSEDQGANLDLLGFIRRRKSFAQPLQRSSESHDVRNQMVCSTSTRTPNCSGGTALLKKSVVHSAGDADQNCSGRNQWVKTQIQN